MKRLVKIRKLNLSRPKLWLPIFGGTLLLLTFLLIWLMSNNSFPTTRVSSTSHTILTDNDQGRYKQIGSSKLTGSGANGGSSSSGADSTSQTSSSEKDGSSSSGQPVTSNASTPPELILSASNITLNGLTAPSGQSVQLTITSNAGPITEPITSNNQKTVALENTNTPPLPTIFRNQWTYTIDRDSDVNGGTDSITFTAQTESRKTLSAQLNVTLAWIPSFTATQGPLTQITNSNGTTTVTAQFTIIPSASFGSPVLHYCDDGYVGGIVSPGCNPNYTYNLTYNGTNDLTLTENIPTGPTGFTQNLNIHIWGDYIYGSYYFNWPYTF